jgi:hypothetical protein
MNFDNEQKAHEAMEQTAGYRLEKNYRVAVSLMFGKSIVIPNKRKREKFVFNLLVKLV